MLMCCRALTINRYAYIFWEMLLMEELLLLVRPNNCANHLKY